MPGKEVAPAAIARALAMRAAGYTTQAIAEELKVSARTLQRHFAARKVRKGDCRQELVDQARLDLTSRFASDDQLRHDAARWLLDDMAHAAQLRRILSEGCEHMRASSLAESVLLMRAAAAYSVALKNTSDMVRQSIGTDRLKSALEQDALPILEVVELSENEVRHLAESHAADDLAEAE